MAREIFWTTTYPDGTELIHSRPISIEDWLEVIATELWVARMVPTKLGISQYAAKAWKRIGGEPDQYTGRSS